jgi:HEAT repeat protein
MSPAPATPAAFVALAGACACCALLAACGSPARTASTEAPATKPAQRASGNSGAPAGTAAALDTAAVTVEASQLRERAFEELLKAATGPLPEQRANAVEALISAPTRLAPVAARALADTNLGVRAVAAGAVGKARLTGIAPMVRPLLDDPSPMVKTSAIFALYKCGQPVDIGPLGTLLRDPNPRVRAQAAYVLGEMGDPSALPMLRDAARDPMTMTDPAKVRLLRLQLAEAIVKLGDKNAIHEIRAALYPARPEELEATALAVQIIGQVKDEEAAYQLIRLATAGTPQADPRLSAGQPMPAEIRMAAAAVLATIGRPRGEGSFVADDYWQDTSPALRAQAAIVYGETRQRANLPKLAKLLDDPEPAVRVSAAAAIVKTTDRPQTAAAR